MMKNKGIRLDMTGYEPKKTKPKRLTEQEKIERLYELADKLHVQIGLERNHYDRNVGVLPKRP